MGMVELHNHVCLLTQGGKGWAFGRHLPCAAISSHLLEQILLMNSVCEVVHVLQKIGPLLAENEFGWRRQSDVRTLHG